MNKMNNENNDQGDCYIFLYLSSTCLTSMLPGMTFKMWRMQPPRCWPSHLLKHKFLFQPFFENPMTFSISCPLHLHFLIVLLYIEKCFFLVVKALKSVFDCFRVFLFYSFLQLCIIHKFKQIPTEISHGISDSQLSPGSPGGHRILFHGCIQAPGQAGRQRNATQPRF